MAEGLMTILGLGSDGEDSSEDPGLMAADDLLEAIKAKDREGIVLAIRRLAEPPDMSEDDEEPEDVVA